MDLLTGEDGGTTILCNISNHIPIDNSILFQKTRVPTQDLEVHIHCL